MFDKLTYFSLNGTVAQSSPSRLLVCEKSRHIKQNKKSVNQLATTICYIAHKKRM